ncbi:hypothetical protein HWV62_37169 [Athelia sp. TMB]|nr:hypothetical protein HWV62_37169 [Athelia sp. TMB]
MEYTGRGLDLFDSALSYKLRNEVGDLLPARISIKLDLVPEAHADFMRTIDSEMKRLNTVKGSGTAQHATDLGMQIGAVLQKIVPVIDNFAAIAQHQVAQDMTVGDLVESLREMAGAASTLVTVPEIPGTTDVIQDIGRASLDAALVIHEYTNSTIAGKTSIVGRAAKNAVSDISSRIAECQTRCVDLTSKLDRRVIFDIHTRVKGIQDDQKKERIKAWMKAPDTSLNFNAAQNAHQGDTGSWFTSCPEFVTWKEQGSILWLHGGPGSGKTILCSLAIKDVKGVCAGAVSYAYFFFDGRDSSELNRHESLIRSLIMQFSAQCDGIPLAMDELYTIECRNGLDQPSIVSLERALRLIVSSFGAAYIIVDALDECDKRDSLLQWISAITSDPETSSQLRLMVISRPEPDIKSSLESLKGLKAISVANGQVADDIVLYVDTRLSKDHSWDDDTKQEIRGALVRGANGIWVVLQCEELLGCLNRKELDKQLESLPRGLNEIYEKILARSSRREDLKRFLQLLACAFRPLTVQEIAEAVIVTSTPNGSACDVSRRYKHLNEVLNVCCGLITEVDGIVKLAHFSVKEYMSSEEIKNGAAKYFYASESLSHSASARICLVYLSQFNQPGSVTEENIKALPLSGYAANCFDFHVRSTRAEDMDFNQHLLQIFFGPVPNYTLANWVQLRNSDISLEYVELSEAVELVNSSAPLYYASAVGLTQVVHHLIKQGADPNVPSGPRGTALHGAAYWGRLEVFKVLLQLGADININGGEYGTVLHAASSTGSAEIVKVLFENSANIDIGGEEFGLALYAASLAGSAETVKVLLEHGADANAEGGQFEFGCALQAASYAASAETVKVLLEMGANVNIGGGAYGSALQAGSIAGSTEIVKLLLESGADVNVKIGEGQYGSALQAASRAGSADIVKLLLEHGADANIGGGQYGSALQAASYRESTEIVKLLLEAGANVNAQGGKYGTALQAASSGKSVEIVKLLLEWGADPNIVGGEYGAALQAASYSGEAEIVKLLLQNGAHVNASGGEHGTAIRAARAEAWQKTKTEVDAIVKLLKEHGAVENDTASQ